MTFVRVSHVVMYLSHRDDELVGTVCWRHTGPLDALVFASVSLSPSLSPSLSLCLSRSLSPRCAHETCYVDSEKMAHGGR